MICEPGYYRKRMKYYRRQEKFWGAYIAKQNLHSEVALENMIRCHRRADWYRQRLGMEPCMSKEPVFVLELTKDRYNAAVRNYGPSVLKILTNIFKVKIPEEWK